MSESRPSSPPPEAPRDDRYEVVDGDVETAGADVVRVWGNSVGWPGCQEEGYRAYYLDPTVERPLLKLLRHRPTGRIVGTLGVGPRRILWYGRAIRAGVLSHLCVEKAHRRIRPARLLIESVLDACSKDYDVVYGMPGTEESEAFSRLTAKVLGWHLACTGTRRVRILRYGKYVRRLLPGPLARLAGGVLDVAARLRDAAGVRGRPVAARWIERVDPAMAALWRDSPRVAGWDAVRDEKTLRWRFDGLAVTDRRYLLVNDGPGGPLLAWFACDTNPVDPDILVVEDFCCARGMAGLERRVVRALCRETRALGFSAVEMRLAAPEECFTAWVAERFVERNRGHVYMRWLNEAARDGKQGPYHITELDDDG